MCGGVLARAWAWPAWALGSREGLAFGLRRRVGPPPRAPHVRHGWSRGGRTRVCVCTGIVDVRYVWRESLRYSHGRYATGGRSSSTYIHLHARSVRGACTQYGTTLGGSDSSQHVLALTDTHGVRTYVRGPAPMSVRPPPTRRGSSVAALPACTHVDVSAYCRSHVPRVQVGTDAWSTQTKARYDYDAVSRVQGL